MPLQLGQEIYSPRKLTAWTWSHEGLEDEFPLEDGCFQKYGYPKMEGENNGHPY